MLKAKSIALKTQDLESKLLKLCPEILNEFPIEIQINEIKSYPESKGYKYVCPKVEDVLQNIESEYNGQALALYHKLILSYFIQDSIEKLKYKKMPRNIIFLYHEWFARVLEDLSRQPDGYYDYKNDSFLKDLGVCSLRAIPVGGAWIVDISQVRRDAHRSDRKRRFLSHLRNALLKLGIYRYIQFTSKKLGLYKSFYVIHTYDRYLPRFTPEEMESSYIRIAELLKLNPGIKGVYRSSWFLDPALEKISPHLAFLRKIPEENGAKIFPVGTGESDIEKATSLSPVRKKLFEEGKYIPTCYAYIWFRERLVAWADKQSVFNLFSG